MQINLMSPINNLGYGIVGTNVAHELTLLCHDISLFPLNKDIDAHQIYYTALNLSMQNTPKFNADAPTIKIWHQWDMATFVGRGPHIGFTFFELDSLTPYEVHQLNSCTHLFVASQWAKSVCIKSGVTIPIFIVPLGVNRDIFSALYTPPKSQNTIFGCFGKFEMRKGQDILAEAWNALDVDNVELWLCCDNPHISVEENDKWKSLFKKPGVKFLPRFKSQDELANIMSRIDCGVFASRGEGWNLEVLELMSFGIPSIVGNHTAHTEFCNTDNSYLIEPTGYVPAFDGVWFKPGGMTNQGNWAELNPMDITNAMRNIARSSPKEKKMACLNTAEKYTWKNTAQQIISYLSEITKI